MLDDKQVKGFEEITKDGRKVVTHDEYHDKKARQCGCGQDCCNNVYHWTDKVTGERYVEYVSNGQKVLEKYSDFLSTGADVVTPPCTYISSVEDNATDVSTTVNLTWLASTGATGYKVTIGTTSGGGEVCNALNVGSVLSVIPGTTAGIAELSNSTEYFVRITPYNDSGVTGGCTIISFTTIAA